MSKLQRVVLLGKTGAGKSSLGNTLLGRDAFMVARGMSSGTEKCQFADAEVDGLVLQVTDTPGLRDTNRSDQDVLKEISKSVALVAPGPHVILMVLRCDRRFTEEEHYAYTALMKLFGEDMQKYMIIVFVGLDALGDTAEEQQMVLKEQTEKLDNPKLKRILADADERYIGISNVAPREERNKQAQKLLAMMKDLIAGNDSHYFSNPLCEKVGHIVEEQVHRQMRQDGNTTRQKAEKETKEKIAKDQYGPEFWEKVLDVVSKALQVVLALVTACKGGASKGGDLKNCSLM